jgi:hypothetical protein
MSEQAITRDAQRRDWKSLDVAFIFLFAVLVFLILDGCNNDAAPHPSSSGPPAPTPVINYANPTSWFIRPTASRNRDGGIVISATTNIPDGVNLWVQLATGATSKVRVVGGKFSSEAFTDRGKPLQAGSRQVIFTAYFNAAWQQPAGVLALTGQEGSKLHGSLFHKTDPDVSDSPKFLEYKVQIQFPPVSRELEAISLVQGAVLTVDGRRSSATVGETVKWFLQPSTGIRMGKGWTATKTAGETYTVQLDIVDAANDGPAIWQADLHSRKVRYVNMAAKSMSYLPRD